MRTSNEEVPTTMQRAPQILTIILTVWRNWSVGAALLLCGLLLADGTIFRHDITGHRLLVVAVAFISVGLLLILLAIAHAIWIFYIRKRHGCGV